MARKAANGHGRAVLRRFGDRSSFEELSYTYPLKLLSPASNFKDGVSLVYMLSYGGGLVGGDQIHLMVDVGAGAVLVILTQGSTKVFPARTEARLSSALDIPASPQTTQTIEYEVAPDGFILLLPDPVTPFQHASYSQTQTFHLRSGASVLMVDWFTSGRMSRGEVWAFSEYRSINEIWSGGRLLVRDALLLESASSPDSRSPIPPRTLKDKLGIYDCYATVMLYGPLVQTTIRSLKSSFDNITVMQQNRPPQLIWSFSLLEGVGVIRVAAEETAMVRNWLKESLVGVVEVVGKDAYGHAFPA